MAWAEANCTSYPNSAEALQFTGLDYIVEKRRLPTFDNENNAANEDQEIKIPEIEVPTTSQSSEQTMKTC